MIMRIWSFFVRTAVFGIPNWCASRGGDSIERSPPVATEEPKKTNKYSERGEGGQVRNHGFQNKNHRRRSTFCVEDGGRKCRIRKKFKHAYRNHEEFGLARHAASAKRLLRFVSPKL
jgi:hypothetical protein